MKARFFTVMLLSVLCAAQQKSTLPLPDSGNVTLTLDEYNKLVELATKPLRKSEAPPLAYAIQHATAKLRVENDSVRGTVQLDGEIYRKGISKVALTSGMTILDAQQNGKGIPLQQENGMHSALLAGPGEFSVSLETGLPLRIEAARASFHLPVPDAGSAQLTLVIPGDHTYANIDPGLITSRKSENGHTTIEATLLPGQPASIWWTTREVAAPAVPRETRFLSEVKTLVSVSEEQLRVAALADVTVVQGAPSQFQIEIPAGYEITNVTGPSLDSAETQSGNLFLKVNARGQRNCEFLISMERAITDAKADAPFLSFKGAQRETGEVLVEGTGAMEITTTESGGLKRMDVKEANPYLQSMAHFPPQAAFRYHRQPSETPALALQWVRFPDSPVLAAIAENAVVTTLVTLEGKSLTEVRLILKNQAQPFLKVALPAGATIISADVAGERVKPVQGPDGNRVPLLRPGFRPTDAYTVSFVFMHSGVPFAKKGGAELSLPNMDIPIVLLNWEIFLPDQYKVKDFGGDVIAAKLVPTAFREETVISDQTGADEAVVTNLKVQSSAGQMGGSVTDPSGAVIANARVTVTSAANTKMTRITTTDSQGRWVIAGMPSGNYNASVEMPGFKTSVRNLNYDADQPSLYNFSLNVGSAAGSVEVSAGQVSELATVNGLITEKAVTDMALNGRNFSQLVPLAPGAANQGAPSANVVNLQRRVAGVLPVAIDVPHVGTSFAFVRPLVLSQETKVTFSYKSK